MYDALIPWIAPGSVFAGIVLMRSVLKDHKADIIREFGRSLDALTREITGARSEITSAKSEASQAHAEIMTNIAAAEERVTNNVNERFGDMRGRIADLRAVVLNDRSPRD